MTSYSFEGVPVAPWIKSFLDSLDNVIEHNRRNDEAVAAIAGVTVEELDADTTADDPVDVEDIAPLRPFLIQTANACAVFNLKPLCIQCYRRAQKITAT